MNPGSALASGSHQEKLVRLDPHGHWRRIPTSSINSCNEALQSVVCCPCPAEGLQSGETAAAEARNALKLLNKNDSLKSDTSVAVDRQSHPPSHPALADRRSVQYKHLQHADVRQVSSKEDEASPTNQSAVTSSVIAEDQRASRTTVVSYAPEDIYNPLYFGSPPEDRAGSAGSINVETCLQYAGAAVAALSGLSALGIGFLFLATGLAVGIGVREVVAECSILRTEADGRQEVRKDASWS